MNKRRKETVYLSQLEGLQILWPGDVRALAEFVLRSFEARDRIVSAGPIRSFEELITQPAGGVRLAIPQGMTILSRDYRRNRL
jgi:hypothetical protein